MKVRAVYRPVNPFSERFHTAFTEWKEVPNDADLGILESFAKGHAPMGYIFLELEVKEEDDKDVKAYGDQFIPKKKGESLQE